ncbi:hypothetical protein CEW88_19150 (plasmid) [Alloyangia pacifica]|uniref:Transposase IS30-like HTH domain-containing protein n=1 Tax=Alloyangia pacifica TaxID=311180 RepID=A0A2U8HIX9_9RHOB|nr:hypothetical protein CEW88_19150 [Alloyangia pacifica]
MRLKAVGNISIRLAEVSALSRVDSQTVRAPIRPQLHYIISLTRKRINVGGGFTNEVQILYQNRSLHGGCGMGRCYLQLSFEERIKIAKWREAKMSIPEIADRLSRAPSTIYRDLKRNHFDGGDLPELAGYYALNAQTMSEKRRAYQSAACYKCAARRLASRNSSREARAGRAKGFLTQAPPHSRELC